MLQWMGGSRRKVNASRKSTHNRQKQYFEQRKRQQQTTGLENRTEIKNKRVHCHEEPRSLDILSLINLATLSHPNHDDDNNEQSLQQVDLHVSKLAPGMVLKKITIPYSNDQKQTDFEPGVLSSLEFPAAIGSQDTTVVHNSTDENADCRMRASSNKFASSNNDSKQKQQKEEIQSEVSLLDLLTDGESVNKSSGKSVPEAHVAFSVKGLGKVGTETPAHSPRPYQMIFLSPPKAQKCTKTKSTKSISFDAARGLNFLMDDISMTRDEGKLDRLENLSGILDEFDGARGTHFVDSHSLYSFKKLNNKFDDVEEDMYNSDHIFEGKWNSGIGSLDGNLLGKKSDGLWKMAPSHSEDYFSTSLYAKNSNVHDYSFKDHSFPKRTKAKAGKRVDISAPSSPSFITSTMEEDCDLMTFDWERERSNFDSILNPPVWSFKETSESQDSLSLLSEESCSSTAVREERSHKLQPQKVKLKENKTSHRDELQMSFNKKHDVKKFPTEKTYKNLSNKLKSGAAYCTKKSFGLEKIPEPECFTSFTENTDLRAASFCSYPTSFVGADTISTDCKLISPDELFNLSPDPKLYPTVDSTQKKLKSKSFIDYEPFSSTSRQDNVLRQRSGCVPFSFISGVSQKDIEMYDLSGKRNVGKIGKVNHEHFDKPENKVSVAEKFMNSPSCATAMDAGLKENLDEDEESKDETKEQSNGSEIRNCPEVANETLVEKADGPAQQTSFTNDEKENFDNICPARPQKSMSNFVKVLTGGESPFASEVSDKEQLKEKLGDDSKDGVSTGENSCDTQYQVMLESYVLRLLCVQKVLMEASDNNRKKNARGKREEASDAVVTK
ncbi:uncharacterized protein LOC109720749 isoform X3 [Ananas comosus]|uniref:Uncharacterized protein LOC109720749 isoform X3 n=1 Tax=Ananas comosus TaxID=4615 RepID=A0A6P5G753_ANACO|nr:uncharacterized protein LOC109720749 isoform X3 [Ananas comosus]